MTVHGARTAISQTAAARAPVGGHAPASVAIIGAGISGLTAAHYLTRLLPPSSRIVVIEAADRFGGWIKSLSHITPPSHPSIDAPGELIFETGPRSVTTKGLAGWRALDLVKNLGLQNELATVARTSDAAKNRLIYYPDHVGLLPRSLPSLVFKSRREPNIGLLSALLREPWQPARRDGDRSDESIDAFFRRRLGPVVADKIISAVIHGIWGGDSRQLSMHAAFPSVAKMERDCGGLLAAQLRSLLSPFRSHAPDTLDARDAAALSSLRATFAPAFRREIDRSMSWSLQGGLETLVDSLVDDLGKRGVDVRLGVAARSISPAAEGVVIETDGGSIESSHVVSALPATKLADLLPGVAPLPHLRYNPSATIGVVNLAFLHAASFHFTPIAGAGYLVPRNVERDYNPYGVLGVTFDSDLLPTLDSGFSLPPSVPTYAAPDATVYTKLSVLIGGPHWADKPAHAVPQGNDLVYQAVRTLQGHFDWPRTLQPSFAHAHLHRDCIPQYLVGHPSRMRAVAHSIRTGPWHGRLSLAGASYLGVGVRDCILSGYEIARRLAAGLPAHGLERLAEDGATDETDPSGSQASGLAADATKLVS